MANEGGNAFGDMMQMMMGTAFSSLGGGAQTQPGDSPQNAAFANQYGGDMTITGTAAGMGQPSMFPVPQVAPQSGGSWFQNAMSGLMIGLSHAGNASDPATAFGQGMQAVELQRRQNELEAQKEAQVMAQQAKVQQAWEASRAKNMLDMIKLQQDIEQAPQELQIKATNANASLITAMAAAHKSPAMIVPSTQDGLQSFQQFVQQSNTQPWQYIPVHTADGQLAFYETDPYDIAPANTPPITLPDGSQVAVAGKPWTFAKDIITTNTSGLYDMMKQKMIEIGNQNVANTYAGATVTAAKIGALGRNQLTPNEQMSSLTSQMGDALRILNTPPPIGATPEDKARYTATQTTAQQMLTSIKQQMDQLRSGNTPGGGNVTYHLEGQNIVSSNGKSMPIGSAIPSMPGYTVGWDPSSNTPTQIPPQLSMPQDLSQSLGAPTSPQRTQDMAMTQQVDNVSTGLANKITALAQQLGDQSPRTSLPDLLQAAQTQILQSDPSFSGLPANLQQFVLDSLKRKLMMTMYQSSADYQTALQNQTQRGGGLM